MDMELFEGRPADCSGRQEREVRVYDLLDRLGIAYQRTDHEPAGTMEDCDRIDAVLEVTICKNLFLCNRQKTAFYLLMMPGHKAFRTKDLSAQLGVARLSFGTPEDMLRLLDLTPGSVSVMGLMNDRDNQVQLVIDRDVLTGERVGCHPCLNTSSLRFATSDLLEKVLPAMGHSPILVNL